MPLQHPLDESAGELLWGYEHCGDANAMDASRGAQAASLVREERRVGLRGTGALTVSRVLPLG